MNTGELVGDWILPNRNRHERADGPISVQLSMVEPEAVSWVWPGHIPLGKLTLIVGDPGVGKSHFTLDLASRMTTASLWPDAGRAERGAVVVATSEDGIADTIVPRVHVLGGDDSMIHILKGVIIAGEEYPFNLERDLGALEQIIVTTQARLVILDPINAYLGDKNSFKDSEIRSILTPLADLAEAYRVAVVGIQHLTKSAQRKILMRAQGSIAFVAQARVVLAVGEDPECPERRLVVALKNNLGPMPPALAFRIGGDGLTWDHGPVTGSADRLLAEDEPATRSERRERDGAQAFLREALAQGPVASKLLQSDAKANGISPRTLSRAKDDLGIKPYRSITTAGSTGPWFWSLPQ